ncbi:hypothetical protein [Labrys neptuniae]
MTFIERGNAGLKTGTPMRLEQFALKMNDRMKYRGSGYGRFCLPLAGSDPVSHSWLAPAN